jgi:YfiH family protein
MKGSVENGMEQEPFIIRDPSYMILEPWENINQNLLAGISTRNEGTSAPPYHSLNVALHVGDQEDRVLANREQITEKLGVNLNEWVCADQVHGSTIQKVENRHKGKGAKTEKDTVQKTDGLYTKERNLFLAMFYADCVPLFFFAPEHGMIGLAHAGWRGTVKNIAGKMIGTWGTRENIKPEQIHAAIGPSIGPCCYEVDHRVISEVDSILNEGDAKPYRQTDEEHFRLDLRRLNFRLLEKAGVPADHIEQTSYCTSCNNDLFFSHRKENGKTGRFMGFMRLS